MKAMAYAVCVAFLLSSANAATPLRAGPTLAQQLKEIQIPEIQFREAALPDVLAFLSRQSGVNFVLLSPSSDLRPVTLSLHNVPLSEVLRYVAEATGLRYRVDSHAVVWQKSTDTSPMETRVYPVAGPLLQKAADQDAKPVRLRRPEDF